MAHLIHSINTTASGLCHHLDSVTDGEHQQYAIDLTLSADLLIFGQNTFDLFMQLWPGAVNRKDLPEATVALAKALAGVPKLVVSSRPVELSWSNTRYIQGPSLRKVAHELDQVKGSAVIFGSPSLASSLLNEGLVNEIHILAQPYVGIEGPRAFSGLNKRVSLSLIDSRSLKEGSVLLRYSVS